MAAACGRCRRSGSSTAPPTPPACCGRSDLAPAIVVGYSMGGAIAQLRRARSRGRRRRAGPERHRAALPGRVSAASWQAMGRSGWRWRSRLRASGRGHAPARASRTTAPHAWCGRSCCVTARGHRRGRPRARPVRLAAVAARRRGPGRGRPDHARRPPCRRASSASSRLRRARRVFEAPIDHLEITTSWRIYNPPLLSGDRVGCRAAAGAGSSGAFRGHRQVGFRPRCGVHD